MLSDHQTPIILTEFYFIRIIHEKYIIHECLMLQSLKKKKKKVTSTPITNQNLNTISSTTEKLKGIAKHPLSDINHQLQNNFSLKLN